jgi:hypothetical protein
MVQAAPARAIEHTTRVELEAILVGFNADQDHADRRHGRQQRVLVTEGQVLVTCDGGWGASLDDCRQWETAGDRRRRKFTAIGV